MTKFVGVVSGKGGVGKTTIAINLACALNNFGRNTIVMDANLSNPHVSLYLGYTNLPNTLNDALKGSKNISDVAYLHPSGLKLIPASFSYGDRSASLDNLKHILVDLLDKVDVVFVDLPPGLHDDQTKVLQNMDSLIVVANPDLLSVSDALKVTRYAYEKNIDVLGVVVNKVVFESNEMTPKNVEVMLDIPLLVIVPDDVHLRKALSDKQPVVYSFPESPSSINFKKIAAALIGQKYQEKVEVAEEKENMVTKFMNQLKELNR